MARTELPRGPRLALGTDEGPVCGCHPSNDCRASWVQITKSCHIRATSSQQSRRVAGFIPMVQMKKPRARNAIVRLRSPRGSKNQAVRVQIRRPQGAPQRSGAEAGALLACYPSGLWQAQEHRVEDQSRPQHCGGAVARAEAYGRSEGPRGRE